jgi:aryl-alcohol dehydrogenase-like predicted oxidoreductase
MSASTSSAPGTITIGGELTVGRIGFGAMRLAGDQVWGEYPDHDGGIALLRHVVDSGVTFIDTADVYGPHSNEELIREALHPYPADLVIATKGGFVRGGYDYSTLGAVGNPNYLRQSVHMSLRRLGLERIDLYYLHSGTATDARFEDQVGVLAELKVQGLIRHIGLSNVTVEQFEAAREIVEVAALTANYNLGTRLGSAHLAAAERAGIVFSPWGPTRLDGPDTEGILHAVDEIARRHGATAQQVALAWHLHRSPKQPAHPGHAFDRPRRRQQRRRAAPPLLRRGAAADRPNARGLSPDQTSTINHAQVV